MFLEVLSVGKSPSAQQRPAGGKPMEESPAAGHSHHCGTPMRNKCISCKSPGIGICFLWPQNLLTFTPFPVLPHATLLDFRRTVTQCGFYRPANAAASPVLESLSGLFLSLAQNACSWSSVKLSFKISADSSQITLPYEGSEYFGLKWVFPLFELPQGLYSYVSCHSICC